LINLGIQYTCHTFVCAHGDAASRAPASGHREEVYRACGFDDRVVIFWRW
jgi:hypothetical protein